MSDRVFLDTSILVYAFDSDQPEKQALAWRILKRAAMEAAAVISTQVLHEFYQVVTRRLKRPLHPDRAEQAVEHLLKLPVVRTDPSMVLDAIRITQTHPISLWDALIIRAAKEGGCDRLLSEAMDPGQTILDVRIENPFPPNS